VRFLEWLKSVKGQVFFVNWVKHVVRYDRPFIKELDAAKGLLHYYSATGDKSKDYEKPKEFKP
jgi:hypothetical protein